MEVKRQLDVLDKQLALHRYLGGEEYTIADIAVWSWYGNLVLYDSYDAREFLDAGSYRNLVRWSETIGERPAVQRGRKVNRLSGPLEDQLTERHDASDFETRTQDKLVEDTQGSGETV